MKESNIRIRRVKLIHRVLFILMGLFLVSFCIGFRPLYCQDSLSELIEKFKKSSVSIYTDPTSRKTSYFEDSPKYQDIKYGSGVIVKLDQESSFILTNYHVVEGGFSFRVKNSKGSNYKAHLIYSDKKQDLSLLKVKALDLGEPVNIDTAGNLKVGDEVYIVGNPKGYSGTFWKAYVSYLGRGTKDLKNLIQLGGIYLEDGSSGAGVFDSRGNLVGILVARDGGVGFCIRSGELQDFLNQFKIKNQSKK